MEAVDPDGRHWIFDTDKHVALFTSKTVEIAISRGPLFDRVSKIRVQYSVQSAD